MKWSPKGYQATAVSFLLDNPNSGLFLDPGLGKTSTSLATIKILKNTEAIKSVLLIAPLTVVYEVWPNEISKWDNFKNLTCTILHGKNKKSLWGDKVDLYLMNPEGLPWLHKELLTELKKGRACPFDTLLIDESTKFKSNTARRFKLLGQMLPIFKRAHIMTGTPCPKSYLDLWAQIYVLDKGEALGTSFSKFRNEFFTNNSWNKFEFVLKKDAEDKIKTLISPLVLEMSSEDYLSLPDLINNYINVNLPDAAFKIYKKMENEFFIDLDEDVLTASNAATSSIKCHQIANGNIYDNYDDGAAPVDKSYKVIHTAKLETLVNLIDELNGKPLLVAYYFRSDLDMIKKKLGVNTPHIGAGVSKQQIADNIKNWNAGKIKVLLAHSNSASLGLNLQGSANDICWYSLTWNLENYIQFIKRLHRQGVKGSVRVHHLIAKNTIDEVMLDRLAKKDASQKSLREAIRKYREFKKL